MVAATALISLVLILAVNRPWLVNPPDTTIQNDPYILDPTLLEFIDFEDESVIPWKDTLLAIKIVVLLLVAVWQISMKQEDEEVDAFLEQCYEDHENISEINKFYTDTEKVFGELEVKSKAINRRLKQAENKTTNTQGYDKAKEDVEFVKESWFQQYSAFSLLDLQLDGNVITEREINMQLEDIKADFDKELEFIAQYMEEDILSLEELTRDTQIIQNHFRLKD